MPWGYHLIIDANECSGNITDINNFQNFINDLCRIGEMKRKGNMVVEEFEDNEYNRERDIVGYSIVQIISLSNITLHINFISKTIYFDFFTCGDLNEDLIISLFEHFFNPKSIKKISLKRDAINAELPFI
jgi:S-adenosylmethionine/arginine decarboxylase-like enzyme